MGKNLFVTSFDLISFTNYCLLLLQDPDGQRFLHLINHPNIPYPGIRDAINRDEFSERSIGLTMNRLYLDIEEHHKICECAQGSPNISESHPYVPPTYIPERQGSSPSSSTPPTAVQIGPQSGRCGIVPIPAPLVFQERQQTAQNQGEQDGNEDQASDAFARSLPAPIFNVIDCSMTNAWFPGHLGGVSFSKIPFSVTGEGMREKVICALDFQPPDFSSVLNRPEESECLSLGGTRYQQQQDGKGKMNAFVYETYDPEKMSMHRGLGDSSTFDSGNTFISASSNDYPVDDPHKCPRCLQRETLIRNERKKAEHRSKMMLDRSLRSYGSGDYDWHQDDEDEDMDEDEDEDEDIEMEGEGEDEDDDEMRDVDVDELGIDVDEIIAQTSCATDAASSVATDDNSLSSSQFVSFGDDDIEQYLDVDDRRRKYYDKCRIGVECKGVADVLLSGEVGFFIFLTLLVC